MGSSHGSHHVAHSCRASALLAATWLLNCGPQLPPALAQTSDRPETNHLAVAPSTSVAPAIGEPPPESEDAAEGANVTVLRHHGRTVRVVHYDDRTVVEVSAPRLPPATLVLTTVSMTHLLPTSDLDDHEVVFGRFADGRYTLSVDVLPLEGKASPQRCWDYFHSGQDLDDQGRAHANKLKVDLDDHRPPPWTPPPTQQRGDQIVERVVTFRVLLPTLNQPVASSQTQTKEESDWHSTRTILVVDDEEMVRTVATRVLERAGLCVLLASDGAEAVELFRVRHDEIDCVLLDLKMPNMNGGETFDELRKINSDVPVILSSGYSEQESIERFAGKGLAGFIHKPYEMASLKAKLRKALGDTK